jgi:hypothetical protein
MNISAGAMLSENLSTGANESSRFLVFPFLGKNN